MLTAIDHIALAVRDLDTAAAGLQTLLGRAPDWRGADGGAEHVWFQLPNIALDVIAPRGAGYTGDRINAHLEAHGEGVWAVAFTAPDIEGAVRRLIRRGLRVSAPRPIRSTHIETGEKRYWTTAAVERDSAHGPLLLIVAPPESPSAPAASAADGVEGLDHLVVTTSHPERAAALYGARLGLEMTLDRTNVEWDARLMFFRCGDAVVEIAHRLSGAHADVRDKLWGLSWRAVDLDAAHARLAAAGVEVSEIRIGRKPGTRVFTVRSHACGVPTIVLGRSAPE